MYARLPQNAILSLGGFTIVDPHKWKKYLNSILRKYYPLFYLKQSIQRKEDSLWTDNDCVLESLEKYLFLEFGLALPRDSLFKVFNPKGEGILPAQMVEAISAAIEPFGYEIDRILAPDAELRRGLGHPGKVVDLDRAGHFEGRAGLCMINLENGISHAFFWKKMDSRKFDKEQFRMAVLIRHKDSHRPPSLSAIDSIDSYCRLLDEYSSTASYSRRLAYPEALFNLKAEIQSLSRCVHDQGLAPSGDFRNEVGYRLASILDLFQKGIKPGRSRKTAQEDALIVDAGLMIRRVFQEIDVIC